MSGEDLGTARGKVQIDTKQAHDSIRSLKEEMERLDRVDFDHISGELDGLKSVSGQLRGALGGIFEVAGGELLADGLRTVGGMMVDAGTAGIALNDTLANTEAQFLALTKDGALTTDMMRQLREEAERLPNIPLGDLAQGFAALIPAAKQAKEPVIDLIHEAERLSALNPGQGIEGSVFALKELLSGDWASAIERFNLSRSAINKLKEEGVPNLEILRRVLADMGVDMSLVESQSNSLGSRWQALLNTADSLGGIATKGAFEGLNDTLGGLLEMVADNREELEKWAEAMGPDLAKIVSSFADIIEHIPWQDVGDGLTLGARGAGILSEKLEELIVLELRAVSVIGGLAGGLEAAFRDKDLDSFGEGFQSSLIEIADSYNVLRLEEEASRASIQKQEDGFKKLEDRARSLARALPELKMPEAENLTARELAEHRMGLMEEEAQAKEQLVSQQEALNQRAADDEARYNEQVRDGLASLRAAREEYVSDLHTLEADKNDALRSEEARHQEEMVGIRADRIAADEERRAAELEAEAEYRAAIEQAEQQHAEKLADLNLQLNRRLEDYERERTQRADALTDRLADLERGYTDKVTDLARQREAIERGAADKRLDIEARLKDRLEDLEARHREKVEKIKEGIGEIEGKIEGNAWALIKNGRRTIESFLKDEDRKRYQQLQKQLADEKAEHDKQAQDLRDEAKTALDENARQEASKLAQLQQRLDKEREAYDRSVADANARYTLDAENRQIAHERAVGDLQARIEAENVQHTAQLEALAARRQAELDDVKAKHDEAVVKLAERHAKEQEMSEANRAAIAQKHADEVRDLTNSYNQQVETVNARLGEIKAAHLSTQNAIRQQLYSLSQDHHARMQELTEQWNGPISQAQYYRELLAGTSLGGTGSVPDALRGALDGAQKRDSSPNDKRADLAGIDGFRALGGPMRRGGAYMVGEDGPELVIPGEDSHVLSNQDSARFLEGLREDATHQREALATMRNIGASQQALATIAPASSTVDNRSFSANPQTAITAVIRQETDIKRLAHETGERVKVQVYEELLSALEDEKISSTVKHHGSRWRD